MPYIKKARRLALADNNYPLPDTAGELNYLITQLCNAFAHRLAGPLTGPGYAEFNEVIGVLESAKLEFYRRMVAPYEDEKKEENGDVY